MAETIKLELGNKPYTASWGTIKFAGDAAIVAREIESLGAPTAQEIVDFAMANETSELYKCFEKDDSVAANHWRVHQANALTCSLKITFLEKEDDEPVVTPYRYFSMTKPKNGRYEKTEVVVKNVDKYGELLATAKAQLYSFKKRYSILSELEEVFNAIDRL